MSVVPLRVRWMPLPLVGFMWWTACASSPGDLDAGALAAAELRAPHSDSAPARTASEGERSRARAEVDTGVQTRESGGPADAMEFFERALKVDPLSASAHLEWAITAEALGIDADHLRVHYGRAAQLAPDDARTQVLAADWLASQGSLEEALAHYDRAGALDPARLDTRTRRGDVLLRLGRAADAHDAYQRALALDETYLPALLGMATAAEELGHLDTAERALRDVVKLQPELAFHRSRLITFLKRTGQHAEALAEARALEKLQPRDPRKLRRLP